VPNEFSVYCTGIGRFYNAVLRKIRLCAPGYVGVATAR